MMLNIVFYVVICFVLLLTVASQLLSIILGPEGVEAHFAVHMTHSRLPLITNHDYMTSLGPEAMEKKRRKKKRQQQESTERGEGEGGSHDDNGAYAPVEGSPLGVSVSDILFQRWDEYVENLADAAVASDNDDISQVTGEELVPPIPDSSSSVKQQQQPSSSSSSDVTTESDDIVFGYKRVLPAQRASSRSVQETGSILHTNASYGFTSQATMSIVRAKIDAVDYAQSKFSLNLVVPAQGNAEDGLPRGVFQRFERAAPPLLVDPIVGRSYEDSPAHKTTQQRSRETRGHDQQVGGGVRDTSSWDGQDWMFDFDMDESFATFGSYEFATVGGKAPGVYLFSKDHSRVAADDWRLALNDTLPGPVVLQAATIDGDWVVLAYESVVDGQWAAFLRVYSFNDASKLNDGDNAAVGWTSRRDVKLGVRQPLTALSVFELEDTLVQVVYASQNDATQLFQTVSLRQRNEMVRGPGETEAGVRVEHGLEVDEEEYSSSDAVQYPSMHPRGWPHAVVGIYPLAVPYIGREENSSTIVPVAQEEEAGEDAVQFGVLEMEAEEVTEVTEVAASAPDKKKEGDVKREEEESTRASVPSLMVVEKGFVDGVPSYTTRVYSFDATKEAWVLNAALLVDYFKGKRSPQPSAGGARWADLSNTLLVDVSSNLRHAIVSVKPYFLTTTHPDTGDSHPIEIVHVEETDPFTNVAVNSDASLCVIADASHSVIVLDNGDEEQRRDGVMWNVKMEFRLPLVFQELELKHVMLVDRNVTIPVMSAARELQGDDGAMKTKEKTITYMVVVLEQGLIASLDLTQLAQGAEEWGVDSSYLFQEVYVFRSIETNLLVMVGAGSFVMLLLLQRCFAGGLITVTTVFRTRRRRGGGNLNPFSPFRIINPMGAAMRMGRPLHQQQQQQMALQVAPQPDEPPPLEYQQPPAPAEDVVPPAAEAVVEVAAVPMGVEEQSQATPGLALREGKHAEEEGDGDGAEQRASSASADGKQAAEEGEGHGAKQRVSCASTGDSVPRPPSPSDPEERERRERKRMLSEVMGKAAENRMMAERKSVLESSEDA